MTTIDIETWATTQQELLTADLKRAKAELVELLGTLRASVDNAPALRVAIDTFESVEMNLSGDLELLSQLYEGFPPEYGWAEADDAELLAAARQAFGGVE